MQRTQKRFPFETEAGSGDTPVLRETLAPGLHTGIVASGKPFLVNQVSRWLVSVNPESKALFGMCPQAPQTGCAAPQATRIIPARSP